MRDPKRIDKFCNQLADIWKKVPDWRFGQLMYNFICETGDPFYWEEDECLEKLRKFAGETNDRTRTID